MSRAGVAILGVVNITPDSFSDGGQFYAADQAAERALACAAEGADIVDLGPASSHPSTPRVSAEEEIRRLAPVLDRLAGSGLTLSLDSDQPATQRYALARGVSMLNDIRGFAHPEFHAELADHDCSLVLMHSTAAAGGDGAPPTPSNVLERIEAFFVERVAALERAGVARRRLILDPGMGFFLGPDPALSLRVLHGLPTLRARLGLPVLIGVSRKSFLGQLTGRAVTERGAATLAAELAAAALGADYLRTHDVRALRDGLIVQRALDTAGEDRAR